VKKNALVQTEDAERRAAAPRSGRPDERQPQLDDAQRAAGAPAQGALNVRSQIDGEVGQLDIELGQSISPGQKIGVINDLSDSQGGGEGRRALHRPRTPWASRTFGPERAALSPHRAQGVPRGARRPV
jgi:hypothetical protein